MSITMLRGLPSQLDAGVKARTQQVYLHTSNTSQSIHASAKRSLTRAQARKGRSTALVGLDTTEELTVDDKRRVLDDRLKYINQKFGKGTIGKLGDAPMKVETFPTGCLALDVALGGGYPKGRIIEIYGPESSGKTTLALHAIAEVQKKGGIACFVDAEHAFDPEYAQRLGINVTELYMSQPDCGETALQIVDELARTNAVQLIAIDSVSALVPRSEIDGEIGSLQVGTQARLMSNALKRLAGSASKSNCTIIFLNQMRYKVGVIYGNPETTSGGQALKYYASVRLDVRKKETMSTDATGEAPGMRVKVKVAKNKVAPPFRTAEFDLMFGTGISQVGSILDAAEATGVVTRRGSYYYFGDEKLGQGRERAVASVEDSGELRQRLEAATRASMTASAVPVQDVEPDALPDDDAMAEFEEELEAMIN